MSRTPSLRTVALLLIVLGLLLWLTGLALVVMREPSWRLGFGYGGLAVFVGCVLWHATRRTGGAR